MFQADMQGEFCMGHTHRGFILKPYSASPPHSGSSHPLCIQRTLPCLHAEVKRKERVKPGLGLGSVRVHVRVRVCLCVAFVWGVGSGQGKMAGRERGGKALVGVAA